MSDMSLCSEDSNCNNHAQPVIAVTWRGSFDICNEEGNGKVHGLRTHLSNKACSKVWDVAVKIPKLLCVEVTTRLDTWPKCFSESPPTDDNIAIYIFPEDESCEQGFALLLDYIISGDLALKSVIGDSELLLFTSLQLPEQHQKFQGKVYFWGTLKGNIASTSYQSDDHPPVQGAWAKKKTNTNKGPLGGTTKTRVEPQCNCCVISEVPPKMKYRRVLSCETTALKNSIGGESAEKTQEYQHVNTCRLAVPEIQPEEVSFVPSPASAWDKASQLETTSVPQGDHLRSLSTNYELSDQSTDLSFLDIVNAANDLAESACADSEHASVMKVGQYTVKHDLGQTLQSIFDKYGDIAQGCHIQSTSGRSLSLGGLCEVLNQLKGIQLVGCRRYHLNSLLAAVTTAESVGLEVSWLHQRYDFLKTTLKGIKNYSALENELAKAEAVAESRKTSLDSKKADMMKLQYEMETLNGQLASLRAEQEDLESKMSNVCLKAKRFRYKTLADRLL